MRTIIGILMVDKMTSPNPSIVLDYEGGTANLGLALDHFGDHNTLSMVKVHSRSGRIFFREAKTPEEKPHRQIIVPATAKIARNAPSYTAHETDVDDFFLLDFHVEDEDQPYVVLANPTPDSNNIVIWDFKLDQVRRFQSIDDYDLFFSSKPECELSNVPIPEWTNKTGYKFADDAFVEIVPGFGFKSMFPKDPE